jgi:hypothetical protein
MKRLKDKNFNEEIKDRIYWSETGSCQEKAVSYYANAILSIDEARLLLVFHVMDRRKVSSSTLIRNLEKILIKQMPLYGYWEQERMICDREKVIALALVDILLTIAKE